MTDLREAIKRATYDLLCDMETPPNPEEHWEGWVTKRIADTALAAIEAAGWQCVPKELTVPMGKAWVALDCEMKSIEDCYRAMLAAAPKPGGEK